MNKAKNGLLVEYLWISAFSGYKEGRTNRKAALEIETCAMKFSVLLGVTLG